MTVADLVGPDVLSQYKPEDLLPSARLMLAKEIPSTASPAFKSLVGQKVAQRLPGMTTASRVAAEDRAGAPPAGPGQVTPLEAAAQARAETGRQFSGQTPLVRGAVQFGVGAMRALPVKAVDTSRIPAPRGAGEEIARGAGAAATVGAEATAAEPLVGLLPMFAGTALAAQAARGALSFGGAVAAQQGQKPVERVVGGLTAGATAGLSRFVPGVITKAVLQALKPGVQAAEGVAATAGKAASSRVAELVARGLSEKEAQAAAEAEIRPAVEATTAYARKALSAGTTAVRAGHAAGVAASSVGFGAAEPLARAAILKGLGEDVQFPTIEEMTRNIGALALLNAGLELPSVARGAPEWRSGAPPAAAPAGEAPRLASGGPGPASAAHAEAGMATPSEAMTPAKLRGLAQIDHTMAEPSFAPGTTPAQQAAFRQASSRLSATLTQGLVGKVIGVRPGGQQFTFRVVQAKVYPYPGEPDQVRLMVEDVPSGTVMGVRFSDVNHLVSVIGPVPTAQESYRAWSAAQPAGAQAPAGKGIVPVPSPVSAGGQPASPQAARNAALRLTGPGVADAIVQHYAYGEAMHPIAAAVEAQSASELSGIVRTREIRKLARSSRDGVAFRTRLRALVDQRLAASQKGRVTAVQPVQEAPKALSQAGISVESRVEGAPSEITQKPAPVVTGGRLVPGGSESPVPVRPSGAAPAPPVAPAGARPPVVAQVGDTRPRPTSAPAERILLPNFQFPDQATAERVAAGLPKEAAARALKTKKGWEIEVNPAAAASRLKKTPAPAKPTVPRGAPAPVAAAPGPGPPVARKGVLAPIEVQPSAAMREAADEMGPLLQPRTSPAGERIAAYHARREGKQLAYNRASMAERAEARQKAASAPGQAPPETPSGIRGYKSGEAVVVPYSGRSSYFGNPVKRRSELGVVEGYAQQGGETVVHVRVRRGKSTEDHFFPERMIRRRPHKPKGTLEDRFPRVKSRMDAMIGGDLEKARAFLAESEKALAETEATAQRLYESEHQAAHDTGMPRAESREFLNARAKMTRLENVISMAHSAILDLERAQPGYVDPFLVKPLTFTTSAFGVGELHEAVARGIAALRVRIARARARAKEQAAADAAATKAPVSGPVRRVLEAIKAAEPLRVKQEEIYHRERTVRAGAAQEVGRRVKGEKGFYAELGELKGEHTKIPWNARANMEQADVDALFQTVADHPGLQYFETVNGREALAKLLGYGMVPTDSELALLEKVFGAEFVKQVLECRPALVRLIAMGYEIANVPRALMASYDLSAALRQGLFLGAAYPKEFGGAFRDMFGQFASEKHFRAGQEYIRAMPTFELMRKSGLALTDLGRSPTMREEAFMGGMLAEKIWVVGRGVRASNRAYSGFLNRLRADAFNVLVGEARASGRDPGKDLKLAREIAAFVNTASGRGGGKFLRDHMVGLNAIFFSPRLIASRLSLLNPAYYVTLDPLVRKAALRGLLTLAGAALTVLSLAALAGAHVERDYHSADWLKIKIGNTRYDILGGFQQYLRAAILLINPPKGTSRWAVLSRFTEQKFGPVVAFAVGLLRGTTTPGLASPDRTLGPKFQPSTQALKMFVPLVMGDAYDLVKEWGPAQGLGMAIPGVFGVGLQTYHSSAPADATYRPTRGFGSMPTTTSPTMPSMPRFH